MHSAAILSHVHSNIWTITAVHRPHQDKGHLRRETDENNLPLDPEGARWAMGLPSAPTAKPTSALNTIDAFMSRKCKRGVALLNEKMMEAHLSPPSYLWSRGCHRTNYEQLRQPRNGDDRKQCKKNRHGRCWLTRVYDAFWWEVQVNPKLGRR